MSLLLPTEVVSARHMVVYVCKRSRPRRARASRAIASTNSTPCHMEQTALTCKRGLCFSISIFRRVATEARDSAFHVAPPPRPTGAGRRETPSQDAARPKIEMSEIYPLSWQCCRVVAILILASLVFAWRAKSELFFVLRRYWQEDPAGQGRPHRLFLDERIQHDVNSFRPSACLFTKSADKLRRLRLEMPAIIKFYTRQPHLAFCNNRAVQSLSSQRNSTTVRSLLRTHPSFPTQTPELLCAKQTSPRDRHTRAELVFPDRGAHVLFPS